MSGLNLPPLPPVGGEVTGRPVTDVIVQQHRELLELCSRLTADPADKRVAQVVVAQLSRHLSAEEQYLYPAVRQVVPSGDELADRELAEDHSLLLALQDLDRSASDSSVAAVVEAVRRHVEADAAELLPRLAREVPVEDLIRVGNRVETAGEAAPTRPHPGTPSRPPWNKIVDPVVALADKTMDALSRRSTYPEDLH